MPATYKFIGVPKTFETRDQAVSFLMHSPGYVKRRQKYLAKYWPGLLADVKGRSNKPTRASITKVGEIQSLRQRSAELRGVDTSSLLDKIGGVAAKTGSEAGKWAKDQTAQTVGAVLYGDRGTNPGSAVPGRVQHASRVAEKVVPSPHTVEAVGDLTLGKGLTNLAQGQGPKNWQDVAGLGVGVAGVFPFGRGIKAAGEAIKSAKAAEEAAQAAKVAKVLKGAPKPPRLLNDEGHDIEWLRGLTGEHREKLALAGYYAWGWDKPATGAMRKRAVARWQSRVDNELRIAQARDAAPEGVAASSPPVSPPKPPRPTASGGGGIPPLGPKTLNETVQDALKGAPEAIAAQNKLYSEERAIRAKGAVKAYYDNGGGKAGVDAMLGQLKGVLPKIEWNGFTEFNLETADKMIRHIVEESDLRTYEVVRAVKGLDRMMSGRPPQENQRLLLERVFGKANIDSISSAESKGVLGLLHKHGLELWNTPRTLMASFDLSAPFRQGLVAGARHPVIFAKNFKPMAGAWKSEDVARAIMDDIAERANYPRYEKAKLALTDAAGSTALREEQFPPGLLDKAPGVKHSARAYSAFLDKMRVDVFDRMIDIAEQENALSRLLGPRVSHYLGFSVKNVDDPEFLDALGRMINVSTGRGKLPWKTAEKAAPFLNSFLFSPRLMASRIAILNPFYYVNLYRQSPYVARQAAQSFVNTLAGVSTMLYLASNIPGVKVGTNPLSSDFGKIRIGNTRIDIAGGLQQYLVLYSRLAMGKSVSSTTGKTQDLKGGYGDSSRGDVLWRFIQGKFAPSAGMIRDALEGQTFIGEPLTPQGMAYNNLTPLNVQGGIELYKTEGSIPAAVTGGLLSSIGFGVNSYPDKAASGGGASVRSSTKRSNPFRPSTRSNPFRP